MEKVVIVGGGVAGLCALNALADAGVEALLLEAGAVGVTKLCGEFIAPPARPLLLAWGIEAARVISQVCFVANRHHVLVDLPQPALAYPRHTLELTLAARAREHGGRIMEHALVHNLVPATHSSKHHVSLASGEVIESEYLFMATGRLAPRLLPRTQPPSTYLGFKAYLPGVLAPERLVMVSFSGGYLGIVPVSSTESNMTCILKRSVFMQHQSPMHCLRHIMLQQPESRAFCSQIDWSSLLFSTGDAHHFGLKKTPNWPQTAWIGDALASLYPSIGYGFAHSLLSAVAAVGAYVNPAACAEDRPRLRQLRTRWRLSRTMHYLLQNPFFLRMMADVVQSNPWMSQWVLNHLDY